MMKQCSRAKTVLTHVLECVCILLFIFLFITCNLVGTRCQESLHVTLARNRTILKFRYGGLHVKHVVAT